MAKNNPGPWSSEELLLLSAVSQFCGFVIYRAMISERNRRIAVAQERERTEERIRDSIIKALGISVIEEQHKQEQSASYIKADETVRLIQDRLTPRERDVLREVATGASNQEIAARLYISVGTVKITLRNILRKLNVRNRIEAAVYAAEAGLEPNS